jgi:hypothetical protein
VQVGSMGEVEARIKKKERARPCRWRHLVRDPDSLADDRIDAFAKGYPSSMIEIVKSWQSL